MAESKRMQQKNQRQKTKRGRRRTVKIGALNITMHPHDAGSYVELLGAARRSKSSIVLYGKSCGRIGVFSPLYDGEPDGPHYGEFHRYINIDVDAKWYDTEQNKQADPDAVRKVQIPANLKPEYQPFRFVFYPKHHRLFFEIKAHEVGPLTPAHAQKLLEGLFSNERLLSKFGKVDVTIEPAADTVERILSLPKLRTLDIEVTRPNTDDFSRLEQSVYTRMQDESAASIKETLVAQHGASLTPTPMTKQLCKIAASNGKVVGEGRDQNNKSRRVSTVDYPWTEAVQYLSSTTPERDAFLRKAKEMLDELMERLKK